MKVLRVITLFTCITLLLSSIAAANDVITIKLGKPKWGAGRDERYFLPKFEEYNRLHPDVKIEPMFVPGNYQEKLLTLFAGAMAPDIIWMPVDWAADYIDKGIFLDLKGYVPEEIMNDLFPISRESWTIDGKFYGLASELSVLPVLYYRTDFFEEAGIADPPRTWEELVSIGKKLTTEERVALQVGWSAGALWGIPYIYPFIWQAGARVTDRMFNPTEATANTPEMATVFQFIGDAYNKHKIATPSLPKQPFRTGKVAMAISGGWMMAHYDKAGTPYGVVPSPRGPVASAAMIGGWAGTINSTTEYPQEAIDFLLWLNGDTQRIYEWSQEIGCIPPLQSAASLLDFDGADKQMAPFDYMVRNFDVVMPVFSGAEIGWAVIETTQEVIFKGMSGENAAKLLHDKVSKILGK